MKKLAGNIVKKVLFPLFGIGLMYWAYHKMDMSELLNDLRTANYMWVFMAFTAGWVSHLLRAVRWRMLIEPIGDVPRLKTTFYAVMGGYLFNFLVPRMGEVSRCVMLSQTDRLSFEKLVGTVFIERVVDVIFMMIITISVILLQYDLIQSLLNEQILPMMGGGGSKFIVLGAIGIAFLLAAYLAYRFRVKLSKNRLVKRIFKFFSGLAEGAKSIMKLKKPGKFIFISVAMWVLYFLMAYWIFFALDKTQHLGVAAGLTTVLMGTIAIVIPSPGGIGTYHVLVPAGLALYSIDPDLGGKSYALVSHGTQMIMIFLLGGVSVILASIEKRKKY